MTPRERAVQALLAHEVRSNLTVVQQAEALVEAIEDVGLEIVPRSTVESRVNAALMLGAVEDEESVNASLSHMLDRLGSIEQRVVELEGGEETVERRLATERNISILVSDASKLKARVVELEQRMLEVEVYGRREVEVKP